MKTQGAIIGIIVLSLIFLQNGIVCAQSDQGTAFAGRLGTLGWGLELIQSLNENVNLRFGLNHYTGDYDGKEDDVEYDIDINLRSGLVFVDWHPYEGEFRVTGGFLYNGNHVNVLGEPTDSLTIGDTRYTPSAIGDLTYKATFSKIAPYLGIGFGNATQKDRTLGFVLDFGIAFQGSPEIEISASGWMADNQAFQEDLEKEKQELEEDIEAIKYYPVLAFGFTYKFR